MQVFVVEENADVLKVGRQCENVTQVLVEGGLEEVGGAGTVAVYVGGEQCEEVS